MFKKTPFNPAKPNLFTEIGKGFSGLKVGIGTKAGHLCRTRPRAIFTAMIVLMLVSLALCFLTQRKNKTPSFASATVLKPLSEPVVTMGGSISKIQLMLALQASLDTLAKKDHLTAADSIAFGKIVARMSSLKHQH